MVRVTNSIFSGLILSASIGLLLTGCGADKQPDTHAFLSDVTAQDSDQKDSVKESSDKEDSDKENSGKNKKVTLTVWGAQEDTQLMEQIINSFEKEYIAKTFFWEDWKKGQTCLLLRMTS